MSVKIIWYKKSLDFLRKMNKFESERIVRKIKAIKNNPERYIFFLVNKNNNKIRIGDYRLFVDYKESKLKIYSIKHRKNAYKK